MRSRGRSGPTSFSRIYDSQPRTFSLRERERIVRKARETPEAVEKNGELLVGPVLAPVERAAVVDGDVLGEPGPEPERAFIDTPEHTAKYLRMSDFAETKVEVPDVSGLPNYFQDNPWVAILARRAREAELVDRHGCKGRRFFVMMRNEGRMSEEDCKGAVLLLTATSPMPGFWDRLNDPDFVPDGDWSPEEIEWAKNQKMGAP